MQASVHGNDLLESVLPQFFPAHWLDDSPDILFSAFPSRIRIGYVLRGQDCYSYVMRPMIEEQAFTLDQVHEAALRNLLGLPMPGLTIGRTPGGPEAFLEDVDDNFRAARLLLPQVQRQIALELGQEYFVAIPCRDWFVCWSKDQVTEWQERNYADAKKAFHNDEYNLTPDVLLFSNGTFTLHQVQSS